MNTASKKSRILVIDDEPALQKALLKIFKSDNYELVFANNGLEGLTRLEKEYPDLIFLDLRMPGIDGIEVLRRVKQARPHVEVIVLTGHGSDEEMRAFALKLFLQMHDDGF